MPRVLSIGHSYVVALNRRLPHEMAQIGGPKWQIVTAAPQFVHGDLRKIALEPFPTEACRLEPVPAYLTSWPHLLGYGRKVKALLREDWDIVHCWQEPYVFAGAQLAHWAGPSRFVPYTYQNLSKRYPPPFSWIERYTIARSTGWVAGGHTVYEAVRGRPGYSDKPHRIITLGVDTDVFCPDRASGADVRRRLKWSENGEPVVGYLGRFVPEKGVRLLCRVLEGIRSGWRALFVGGGPLEAELRSWAARFPDRVRIATGIPHEGVPAYLNAMDLLVAPSQTVAKWREQLGRMLIEAFACQVPVIASDSGEIPFVISNAGRVVAEADEPGWTAALGELIDSPALRSELGALGRARAEAEFAWPVIARRHLEFFGEMIDRPCPKA
jgi:glycosyltransferase involved in cell wall biosynthesis